MAMLKHSMGFVVAAMLGLAAPAASAAPGATGLADLKSAASESTVVDKTYWTKQCWRHNGHYHCRNVWVSPHRFHDHHHHRHHHRHHHHHGHRHHHHHR